MSRYNALLFEDTLMSEIQALTSQIQEVEQRKAELLPMLDARKQDIKQTLIATLKQSILDAGFSVEEIIPLLQTTKKGKKSPAASGGRAYQTYRHPQDASKIYVRGVLPAWMKQEMVAQGLDPTNKAHRESFKNDFLVKEAV